MARKNVLQVAEGDPYVRFAEQAFLTEQQTERMGQALSAAQRSAAESVDRSADSHEQTARSYEQLAKQNPLRGDHLKHAARHREFALDDRMMANRLRQMADRRAISRGSEHAVMTPVSPDAPRP